MQLTFIFRHRKENLKKCSLQPLLPRNDLKFFSYPLKSEVVIPPHTCLLSFDGPPLTKDDVNANLILIDATWKLASQMEKGLAPLISHLPIRSLPISPRTAYPRKQTDCTYPERGLASVEALYLAYRAIGRNTDGLLDHYYWKLPFLQAIEESI